MNLAHKLTCAACLFALFALACERAPVGDAVDRERRSGTEPGPTVGLLLGAGGLGDQSFNDMTYAGLIDAAKSLDGRIITEEPLDTDEARREAMARLISRGARIIVVSGWEFTDLILEAARAHPGALFVVNDVEINGVPNIASAVFAEEQGAFLAGALAAMMTQSRRIGFIGGMDHPRIRAFLNGYRQGARQADPRVEVLADFLGGPNDYSGFENPELGRSTALRQIDQGADVLFGVAGLSGNGVISAGRDRGKFLIGVDADQDHMARGRILTSVMKRFDRSTAEMVREAASGNFKSGVRRLGLAEGGVVLSPMTYTRDTIGPDRLKRLREYEAAIRSGAIRVAR
jgi:basic membrane protein A